MLGGEAFPITKEDEGINSYAWSPDGKQIALVKTDPERLAAITHNWIWFNHYVFGEKMEKLTLE